MSAPDAVPPEPSAALDALCRSVGVLVNLAPLPPVRLRVRAGNASVEVEWGATGVTAPPVPPTVDPPPDQELVEVCAPIVGTFYHAAQPGAEPFVRAGEMVSRGQQVGIIEAMKLMNPVVTDHDGLVEAVLVPDAAPVEYGQPLITIRPEA